MKSCGHRSVNWFRGHSICGKLCSNVIDVSPKLLWKPKVLTPLHQMKSFRFAHLEVAINLKFDLRHLNLNFSKWLEAQKCYVKALNGWLLKCLRYEPEETANGYGGIGAPPVFVIVYQWWHAMDMLSEKEVDEALQGLFTSVSQLLEQHNAELQQMAIDNKKHG